MATLKKKTQAEIERGQKKAQERFKKMVEQTKKVKEKEDKRGVQREILKTWNKNMARVQIGNQMITGELIDYTVDFKDNERIPLKMLNKEINISSGYSEAVISLTIRNPIGEDV